MRAIPPAWSCWGGGGGGLGPAEQGFGVLLDGQDTVGTNTDDKVEDGGLGVQHRKSRCEGPLLRRHRLPGAFYLGQSPQGRIGWLLSRGNGGRDLFSVGDDFCFRLATRPR